MKTGHKNQTIPWNGRTASLGSGLINLRVEVRRVVQEGRSCWREWFADAETDAADRSGFHRPEYPG